MIELLPAPCDIGAPLKYKEWRSMQAAAVLAAAESTRRFVIQGAPTGFGKSLVYVSQALLTEARTVILTSTKALQSQLLGDFHESGLVEIRGLNSYDCVEGRPTGRFGDMKREGPRAARGLAMTCDEAPCQSGAFCPKRTGTGCLYYDAYSLALGSNLLVTNYAYFMSIHRYGEGLGPIDLLVLDEAHNAVDELGKFIGTELRNSEVEALFPGEGAIPPGEADQQAWRRWAAVWCGRVAVDLDIIRVQIKNNERAEGSVFARLNMVSLRRASELRRLSKKLETIRDMSGEWIIDYTKDNTDRPMVKFDPVWPGEYAEGNLFLGVKKVVMVSATVRPKTAEMLNVKLSDLDFKEYPSTFPVENRPIRYVPTAHMNRNVTEGEKEDWHQRMDQIIDRRLDRKGIIHTVSYPRAKEIYLGSKHKNRLVMHDKNNTRDIIAMFKASSKPLVLVSPVLDTGYDFPYTDAEFQIIAKMPFPVTVDKIMKARTQRDPGYRDYVTAIKLAQMVGRINRAEDDMGETFIIDSDFGWWYFGKSGNGAGLRLMPVSFKECVHTEQSLGPALPKLVRVA